MMRSHAPEYYPHYDQVVAHAIEARRREEAAAQRRQQRQQHALAELVRQLAGDAMEAQAHAEEQEQREAARMRAVQERRIASARRRQHQRALRTKLREAAERAAVEQALGTILGAMQGDDEEEEFGEGAMPLEFSVKGGVPLAFSGEEVAPRMLSEQEVAPPTFSVDGLTISLMPDTHAPTLLYSLDFPSASTAYGRAIRKCASADQIDVAVSHEDGGHINISGLWSSAPPTTRAGSPQSPRVRDVDEDGQEILLPQDTDDAPSVEAQTAMKATALVPLPPVDRLDEVRAELTDEGFRLWLG
ncbi:hypothetical protein MSPP1_001233 [Malassezia sp. CBS 17886]|nr:hypothetical protein MSPP1_001233 [Malassezia sp. CBS 17886]